MNSCAKLSRLIVNLNMSWGDKNKKASTFYDQPNIFSKTLFSSYMNNTSKQRTHHTPLKKLSK